MPQYKPAYRPPKALAKVESALRLVPMSVQELCKATGACRAEVERALAVLRAGRIVQCTETRRMTATGAPRKFWGLRKVAA